MKRLSMRALAGALLFALALAGQVVTASPGGATTRPHPECSYADQQACEWLAEHLHLGDEEAEDFKLVQSLPPEAATYVEQGADADVVWAIIDHFGAIDRVSEALRVAWCESRMAPDAVNGRTLAGGIFQFLPGTWRREAPRFDVPDSPEHRFDPRLSVSLAASVVERDEGWRQWSCRP